MPLAMPWAEETLSNFLNGAIREVVRREVLDLAKNEWTSAFVDRYLDFENIDATLRQQACGVENPRAIGLSHEGR